MIDPTEDFDLSQLKKVDETGEAVPVLKEEPVAEEVTEEIKEEEKVEDSTEDVKEESPAEEVKEETSTEEIKEEDQPDIVEGDQPQENISNKTGEDLFKTIDETVKTVTDGKVNTLEDFFEEYKSLRDSEPTFKDDFIKNAVDYYNKTGSLTPYLEATSVNYEEMTDASVMRYNLKQQNPTLSDRAIERLYKRDVIDKYSLDEDRHEADEVELGKELLKADANKLRTKFVDEQKSFIQPPSKDEEVATNNDEAMKHYVESVNSSESTKDILENKRILVDFNDETFSYEIDNPGALKEMTLDQNKFFQLFSNDKGEIDFNKWYRVASYATDPDTYDQSLITHGIGLGQEKVVKDLKNPSKVTKGAPKYKEPESIVEGIIGSVMRGDGQIKIIK